MNITEITQSSRLPVEIFSERATKITPNALSNKSDAEHTKAEQNWQKSILLDALDSLEQNISLSGGHPLDTELNAPIETFDEALIELSFLRNPFFKEQAIAAQANLNPKDVLYLFSGEDTIFS